jgi:hypothetical protein
MCIESGRKLSFPLGSPPGAPLRVDFVAAKSHSPCRRSFRDKAKLEEAGDGEAGFPTGSRLTASGNGSNDERRAVQGKNAGRRQAFAPLRTVRLFVESNIAQFLSCCVLRIASSGPASPAFT